MPARVVILSEESNFSARVMLSVVLSEIPLAMLALLRLAAKVRFR